MIQSIIYDHCPLQAYFFSWVPLFMCLLSPLLLLKVFTVYVKMFVVDLILWLSWITKIQIFIIKKAMNHQIYYTFTFSIFEGSQLNISVHGTSSPPCTRSLLYYWVPVITQVMEPLHKNDQNVAKNFLGKWPMTTWSFVTATANESCGLCISCLHGSSLPITGVQINWYSLNPRTTESNS